APYRLTQLPLHQRSVVVQPPEQLGASAGQPALGQPLVQRLAEQHGELKHALESHASLCRLPVESIVKRLHYVVVSLYSRRRGRQMPTTPPSSELPTPVGPADWAGWLGLVALVAAFGFAAWWLLASPLRRPLEPARPSAATLRLRRRMAGVVLLSGVLL